MGSQRGPLSSVSCVQQRGTSGSAGGSAGSGSEVRVCSRLAVRNQMRHGGSPSPLCRTTSQLAERRRNGRDGTCVVVDASESSEDLQR